MNFYIKSTQAVSMSTIWTHPGKTLERYILCKSKSYFVRNIFYISNIICFPSIQYNNRDSLDACSCACIASWSQVTLLKLEQTLHILVSGPGEEVAKQLECLKPDQLALWSKEFEDCANSMLSIKGWNHGRWVLWHEGHEHLENIMEVFILE